IVVDDHYPATLERIDRWLRGAGVPPLEPELDAERAPRPGRTLDGDGAAHEFDDLAADGEAQAGAAEPAVGATIDLREALEDRRARLFGDADAGVGHVDADGGRVVLLVEHGRTEADLALVGELDGVADQVH